jgi:carbonic anhydrase
MIKKYRAMVLSCIDPRFQSKVFNYLKRRKLVGKYSSFTIAGAAIGITNKNFKKWQKTFIENLETSIQMHKINKLIVINHKDCGAAKLVNVSKQFNDINENKIHRESFQRLKKIIIKKFPKLYYEFHIMTLKGSIKSFDA